MCLQLVAFKVKSQNVQRSLKGRRVYPWCSRQEAWQPPEQGALVSAYTVVDQEYLSFRVLVDVDVGHLYRYFCHEAELHD